MERKEAIQNAGHEILPKADQNFESTTYRKTCLRFFKLMCATSLGNICVSDHAMNTVDKMNAPNRDIRIPAQTPPHGKHRSRTADGI